jgi:hypothetical protein
VLGLGESSKSKSRLEYRNAKGRVRNDLALFVLEKERAKLWSLLIARISSRNPHPFQKPEIAS